uniref:Uncharacterized protein n=1 Tax=Arundo donax TaxID=35708 RepID=A0A0A8YP47_ARUDO
MSYRWIIKQQQPVGPLQLSLLIKGHQHLLHNSL